VKAYSKDADESIIVRAYIFALDKHGTQIRDSGKLFFTHPLEVSEILVNLKMDQETVVAGLLHDVVEDTEITIRNIEEAFGQNIAKIVDGVTKLSKFESSSVAEKQAENFKKLLLSASSDIRVLIIKLADRLHNMRTLGFRRKSKRQSTARETLEVYAPLAERVGLTEIKDELQDIAFRELNPGIYDSITSRLEALYTSSNDLIDQIILSIEDIAKKLKILYCSVSGRVKRPYSIWKKMSVRNMSFEQLSDIMAFRIIVDSASQCYQILGEIHRMYCVIPGRFRDYISTPKHNNYQSLHTCVIGPFNKRIEIQIRTKEMHAIAEFGVAAHWNYKEGGKTTSAGIKRQQWLKTLAQFVSDASDIEAFLGDSADVDSLPNMVFCITPKGKLLSLPKGASVLDFAYAIHSYVGNHAVGALVNGEPATIKRVLDNGDQVQILTDPNHIPEPIWMEYLVTASGKANIRKFINSLENEKIEMIGRSNFEEFVKRHELHVSDEYMRAILKSLKLPDKTAMFRAIGNSSLFMQDIFPEYASTKAEDPIGDKVEDQAEECPIIGLSGATIMPTTCCVPIPGDRIIGVILPGNKVEVHLDDCRILRAMEHQSKLRTVELSWSSSAFHSDKYTTKIFVRVIYESGNLSEISDVIEKRQASIVSLRMMERCENSVNLLIELEILDIAQLLLIISDLKCFDFIKMVSRNLP
jgi:GTP pyrophosphokinase